ncbi:MAG: zinc-ribbon domain-containing protein [Ktedonobacteraceae bacterium]
MASIYCPQCGKPNDSPSTFCGNCGYTLQATDAATSRSAQGQQSSSQLPPPPPPYAGGNAPSSANYPAGGTPSPYPIGNTPSSPTYPAAGTPPPSYPIGHTPSAPTYPAGGTPPPSYPAGSAASFPTHPAAGTPPYAGGNAPASANYPANGAPLPPAAYPKGEANVPPKPPQQRRKGKKGVIAVLVIVLIVILAGGGAGAYIYLSHNGSKATASNSNPGVTATTAPTQAPTATTAPTQSTTVTAGPTSTTSSSTPGTTPTTSGSPLNSYSATQPGPGCDTGGGTWTPQSITQITCGTQISINPSDTRGYLYLQLPGNQPFAASNTIGVTGAINDYSDSTGNCVGLAELGANAGYLVEYCNSGGWNIYSISSTGAVVKTLANNITSTRSSTQISLSLKGTTLTFTIDSEVHTITVSALQPTKVAVTYFAGGGGEYVTVTNFSYITPSS